MHLKPGQTLSFCHFQEILFFAASAGHRTASPSASECLEERGGVGEPRRFRLHTANAALLVLSLGVEEREITYGSQAVLPHYHLEGVECGCFGCSLRREPGGIRLQCAQNVGHVLENACSTVSRYWAAAWS